jgi:hypothetical protein
MAERRNEPTFGAGARGSAAQAPLTAEPMAAEPPPWEGEGRGGRLWWLLLALLILAGLGWYLWDKGYLAELRASLLGEEAPAPAAQGGLAAAEAAELEALLAAMALDPGPADGLLDEQTGAAIRAFQEMAGLPADGRPSPALLAELRAVAQQLGITVKTGS